MALIKQKLTYNLGFGGADQKTDEKFVELGRPNELANVRFPKTGMIAKRPGLIPAASQTYESDVQIQRAIGIGDKLLMVGKTPAGARGWYTRTPPSDANAAQVTGVIQSVTGTPPVARAWVDGIGVNQQATDALTSGIISTDGAAGASQDCFAYKTLVGGAATVYYTIIDRQTGRIIVANGGAFSASAYCPLRVLAVPGSNSFLIATGNASIAIHLVSTTGILATQTIATIDANNAWDWALFGSTLFVAYKTNSATSLTPVTFPVTSSTLGSATTGTAVALTVAPTKIGVCTPYQSTENAVILVTDATNGLRGVTLNTGTLAVVQALWVITSDTTTRNHIAGAVRADGKLEVWTELSSGFDYTTSVQYHSGFSVGAASAGTKINNLYLCSKPIMTSASTASWAVLGHKSRNGSLQIGVQHGRYLYEGSSVIGMLLRENTIVPPSDNGQVTVPQISALPTNSDLGQVVEYLCADVILLDSLSRESNVDYDIRSIAALRFNVHANSGYAAVEDGRTLLIQGGFIAEYDGVRVAENGFLQYPEFISLTAGGGGSMPSNSTFDFVAVFLFIDAAGQIHRSAPSEVLTGSTGAGNTSIAVVLRSLTVSQKELYGIEVYRTEASGDQFYLADTLLNQQPNAGGTVTVTITGSDTTLISNTPLGQQDGILDNEQPNCPVAIGSIGRRINVVSGDDRFAVVEGKQRINGEGASFFAGITKRITQDGEITGLEAIGERWIAAKERRFYFASGEGADDSGQTDSLSEFDASPMLGVGAASSRVMVKTTYGIVFKAQRGFYLLDPGGGIQPLPGLDDYKDFPIVSGVFHADRNEVHFLPLDGPKLVLSIHETERGVDWRWSIDETNDSAASYADIAVVGGSLYAAAVERNAENPYSLYVEDLSSYYDQSPSYPVAMRFRTGWIPIAGDLQGRGRLYRAYFLGNVKSVHTARVRAAYDYVDDWIDDKSVTSANATTGGSAYQWEFRPSRQKILAVKFEFIETIATSGQGLELNQLMLLVGVQPGAKKLQKAKRAA